MWAGVPGTVMDMSPSLGRCGRPCAAALGSQSDAAARGSATGFRVAGVPGSRRCSPAATASRDLYHRARRSPLPWQVQGDRPGGSSGMPSASFGSGSVRVHAPRGYDVEPATGRSDRDLPADPRVAQRTALVDALSAEDFVVVDRIDLTPRRGRDLGGPPPANRAGTVRVDVDV